MSDGKSTWVRDDDFEMTSSSASFENVLEKSDDVTSRRDGTFLGKWMRSIISILTVISIFGLTIFVFYQEASIRHQSKIPSKHPHQVQHSPNVIYNESIPSKPQLRDANEYILSPSWNVTSPPTTREHFWTITQADLNPASSSRMLRLSSYSSPK